MRKESLKVRRMASSQMSGSSWQIPVLTEEKAMGQKLLPCPLGVKRVMRRTGRVYVCVLASVWWRAGGCYPDCDVGDRDSKREECRGAFPILELVREEIWRQKWACSRLGGGLSET